MIPAHKGHLFNGWFVAHCARRLSRAFSEVWVRDLDRVRELTTTSPLLIVANHTSWWDGLVIIYLTNRLLYADGYALMDAKNLRRYRFFSRVGGFGIDLKHPEDVAAGLRYAARLLRDPGRVVWVFPQGKEVPVHVRPLGFRRGAARIAHLSPEAQVVPMALRYEFGELELPRLFVCFGPPIESTREIEHARQAQQAAVTRQLETIERATDCHDPSAEGFERVMRRREGWWTKRAGRMLDRLASPPGLRGAAPPETARDLEGEQ